MGENAKSRGMAIEKKIEFLESLTGNISNRRSRRWLNDRLLMELVPRLNAEEIRGLFAPPPWGDDVPLSPFCMTNVGEWDKFRHIDMDKEATIIKGLERSTSKRKGHVDTDKMAILTAWHRVDSRTREALRRSFQSDVVSGYEECIRAFVKDSEEGNVLTLHVQDPFHRLLLHGVCEKMRTKNKSKQKLKQCFSELSFWKSVLQPGLGDRYTAKRPSVIEGDYNKEEEGRFYGAPEHYALPVLKDGQGRDLVILVARISGC
ncbi:unnamed protein product [Thlaspi arvense]|uniref:R3H-associated N-terminal domain-containing protein n=1 Tax=Thlaspi arvense TaxID=13288 RepID=A0AAU9RH26_THLAR|nr:unnamed protein product [Thlaspi arvense]